MRSSGACCTRLVETETSRLIRLNTSFFQVPVFVIGLWRGEYLSNQLPKFKFGRPRSSPAPSAPVGTTSIYVLLLIYAASTTTTTVPCLAVILSTPVSPTPLSVGLSVTSEQRLLLLSSYIPFFLVPLVMTFDMASRVQKLINSGREAQKEKREYPIILQIPTLNAHVFHLLLADDYIPCHIGSYLSLVSMTALLRAIHHAPTQAVCKMLTPIEALFRSPKLW